MCLPFQSFEESVVPPNEKSRKYVSYLKIITICQVALSVTELFVGFWDHSELSKGYSAIYEVIAACILYCAYNQLNFCNCVIYIFIALFAMVSDFVIIGKYIQNSIVFFPSNNSLRSFSMALVIISFIYYAITIYLVFQAYREFKAVSYDISGNLQYAQQGRDDESGSYGNYGGFGGYQNSGNVQAPPPSTAPPSQPQAQSFNFFFFTFFFQSQ